MPKRVAILQSNYIPWKGYFDIIGSVDEFIVMDEVQYTRRDWRNRNRIKTPSGPKWLTIPVQVKGKYTQTIAETVVADNAWAERHWAQLVQFYRSAPCFEACAETVESLYNVAAGLERLSEINLLFLKRICGMLGIATPFTDSTQYGAEGAKSNRILGLCRAAGADVYLSGPAARDYLQVEDFEAEGITVEWMDYDGYPEYEQLYPPFVHGVTILDLLFHTGAEASDYLKSTERR